MEMQTTALLRARHMLESQGRFPGGALPSDISESWLRCLSHGLDPLARPRKIMLDSGELRQAQARHVELIRLARPELEQLFDQIAGTNFIIVLGSPEGIVLEALADVAFADSEPGRSIVPGSVWTEELRGTNAFGLSLHTGRSAQVYGGEHFLRAHADVACISAPIFDGRGGIAGVIDASSRSSARQQHTAALVQMSASNIENSLIRAAHDRSLVLQFHPRAEYLGTLSAGMLVLDEDFTVHAVNRKGEMFLAGLPRILGARFGAIFEQRFEDVARRLVQGETLRLRDRMGSALSVRCVANRASFALAARIAATASERDHPVPGMPVVRMHDTAGKQLRNIVVEDGHLIGALRQTAAAARHGKPVLLRGEAGTGKEVIARLAHAAADRKGPFVAVDVRVFGNGDADTAFFGQPDGTPGLFSLVVGGTLFVEEVAGLPLSVQAALMRILDLGEYRHPADGALRFCAPFLVSTSSEPLDAAVGAGRLLPGLRFWLESAVVDLPPLRERSDLGALALRLAREAHPGLALAPETVTRLCRHDWPGNLHELRAVLSQAAMRAGGGVIAPADIAPFLPDLSDDVAGPTACRHCAGVPWKEERCHTIQESVARCGGVAQAARELGMSRTTVYRHLYPGRA